MLHSVVRSFGADHSLVCPACRNMMHLIRRGPHPVHGYDYERQVFACPRCGHEIERCVDFYGLPFDPVDAPTASEACPDAEHAGFTDSGAPADNR